MIDAARVEEIRAALTCAYQVPEWGEITDMVHELFKFIDTLRADLGVAESALFEKRERSKLRQENERWVEHYANLLITCTELEAEVQRLRAGIKEYIEAAR